MSNWKNFKEKKPRKSGLYFVKKNNIYNEIEIAYYYKRLEIFIRFDSDYNFMYILDFTPKQDILWAKKPLLNNRKIDSLETKGIACLSVI